LLCVVVASVVQDEEVVEWSEASEALVHALVTTDHRTHHGLRPSCHHYTGLWGRAVVLHMMTV
jgi:hypothetical protein